MKLLNFRMKFIFKKGGLATAFFNALFFLGGILLTSNIQAQDLQIMFYNVENLFDTIDDPLKFDEDFTPQGKLKYTTDRYNQKQENLSRVINSAFGKSLFDVLGLCEVENMEVLVELKSKLNNSDLDIVHFNSADGRGIDNALMYNTEVFELRESGVRAVDLGKDQRPTRDILWVHLVHKESNEDFFFSVNHWPSRYGGEEKSRWKRKAASDELASLSMEITSEVPTALIIHMGDFNDHPDNESMTALSECKRGPCLQNLCERFVELDQGSHVYRGKWGVLDQFLVNENLIGNSFTYHANPEDVKFFSEEWMMYESQNTGVLYPSRSYAGPKYYGGFSDHLPVTMILRKQE